MKIIRIYAIILLVGLLSLPLDGFANCESAEAALAAAQDRLTAAEAEYAQVVGSGLGFLSAVSIGDVPNSDKPGVLHAAALERFWPG